MNWRSIQIKNFNSIEKLADYLELNENNRKLISKNSKFPLNLPMRLAQKIKKNCLSDPILRQFVPLIEENEHKLDFLEDPVGDIAAKLSTNLLKKYHARALMIPTSACAMHCRYCFRQNYPYVHKKQFEEELNLLRNDKKLEEVILSGGDPLSLSNENLDNLLTKLAEIPHIKRIRFHSRFVIGIPERIDLDFINILQKHKFQYWFIVHINHPNELDEDIFHALKKISSLGKPVLNQAVLLKNINDREEILEELFGKLANYGIFAYYLHQLDKVQGSWHFEVSIKRGLELIKHLEGRLPGYAVPKYVSEIKGALSKTPLHSL